MGRPRFEKWCGDCGRYVPLSHEHVAVWTCEPCVLEDVPPGPNEYVIDKTAVPGWSEMVAPPPRDGDELARLREWRASVIQAHDKWWSWRRDCPTEHERALSDAVEREP